MCAGGDSGASARTLSPPGPACAPAGRATRPLSVEGAVFAFCAVPRCHAARAAPAPPVGRPRTVGLALNAPLPVAASYRNRLALLGECQGPALLHSLERFSLPAAARRVSGRPLQRRAPERTRRQAKKASSASGVGASVLEMVPAACAARSSAASSRMLSTAGTSGHACVSLRDRCGVACAGIVLARWCRNSQQHRKSRAARAPNCARAHDCPRPRARGAAVAGGANDVQAASTRRDRNVHRSGTGRLKCRRGLPRR